MKKQLFPILTLLGLVCALVAMGLGIHLLLSGERSPFLIFVFGGALYGAYGSGGKLVRRWRDRRRA